MNLSEPINGRIQEYHWSLHHPRLYHQIYQIFRNGNSQLTIQKWQQGIKQNQKKYPENIETDD